MLLQKEEMTMMMMIQQQHFGMKNNTTFPEDFERESLKDSVYLLEEQQRIMQEIMEEENRLPARVTVIYENKPQPDELKDNSLPF